MKHGRSILSILVFIVTIQFSDAAFGTPAGWNGRILFRSGGSIASINPDGTGLKIIARPPTGTLYQDVAGTADGRIAVTQTTRGNSSVELVILSADGTLIKNLGGGLTGTVQNPAWSPDGKKIAFEEPSGIASTSVSVINADGTGLQSILNTSNSFAQPAWSPDGTKLAVSVDGASIYIANADGTGPTPLTNGQGDSYPTWSPDGTQIAFLDRPDIFRIDVNGTNLTNLTNGVDFHGRPSWSPDGKRIAYLTGRSSIDVGTMIAVDGSDRQQLTNCDCAHPPDWQSWVDTATGTNVSVSGNGVTVTFGIVTSPGATTVTSAANCNGTPGNFQVGACYEIQTSAAYPGPVEVCITYDANTFPAGITPSIWHGVPAFVPPNATFTLWNNVTIGPVDTTNRIVCGSVRTLSPFALLGGSANQPPLAKCHNVKKNAGPSCNAAVSAAEVNDGSMDPDGDPITLSMSPAGPFSTGATPVVLTATDSQGAFSQCNATVTVVDVTPPTISCPAPVTVDFMNAAGASVTFTGGTASDNCGTPTIVASPASSSVFPFGTTAITESATDPSGNHASCGFTVTVAGAMGVKQSVAAALSLLKTTITGGDGRENLSDAIESLNASLRPAFWIDQVHLKPSAGQHVFDAEKESVENLQALLGDKKNSAARASVQDAVNRIIRADRLLADVAIRDATNAHGRAQQIADALREQARADSDAAAGQFSRAVERYGKAWAKANASLSQDGNDDD
jgi:hypothetical protein